MPAGTKCTGGKGKNLCLLSLTTDGGFGNCVVASQGGAAKRDTRAIVRLFFPFSSFVYGRLTPCAIYCHRAPEQRVHTLKVISTTVSTKLFATLSEGKFCRLGMEVLFFWTWLLVCCDMCFFPHMSCSCRPQTFVWRVSFPMQAISRFR
jgi:hypothetical protein